MQASLISHLPAPLTGSLYQSTAYSLPPACFSQDFDLLLISLADENDNHPLFTEGTYQAEVMENSPAGRCWARPGAPAVARHCWGLRHGGCAVCPVVEPSSGPSGCRRGSEERDKHSSEGWGRGAAAGPLRSH